MTGVQAAVLPPPVELPYGGRVAPGRTYVLEQGTFRWCVRHFDLGNPPLTLIGRTVCQLWSVWPEQLVGRDRAYPAVSLPDNPPLALGHSPRPRSEDSPVRARRHAWCLARILLPTLTVEDLADAFGGYSTSAVYEAWRHAFDFDIVAGLEAHLVRARNGE